MHKSCNYLYQMCLLTGVYLGGSLSHKRWEPVTKLFVYQSRMIESAQVLIRQQKQWFLLFCLHVSDRAVRGFQFARGKEKW